MRMAVIVTIGAVLFWAVLITVSRVLLLRYDLDPWAFTFVQLCSGGTLLLLAGGRGRMALASFRRPATWTLGVLRVLSAGFFTAVVAWVSAMEAGILGAVNVPMVALAVWAVFGRRPARQEWIGHVAILAAIALLVATLDGGFRHPAVVLMLLNEVCLVSATLLAERHPDNASAESGARLRFTGAVLLVTAGLFLALRLYQGDLDSGAWSGTLLLAGAIVGVLLRGPSMVLAFWSTRLVGAQNYMAAASALPVLGMVLEGAAFRLGLIDVSRFQPTTALLAVGTVAGTLLVAAARIRAARPAAAIPPR